MGRKRKDEETIDRKSAAAGERAEESHGPAEYVFDGPFDADKAVEHLLELNRTFHERDRIWEQAKAAAAEAKSERDDASNTISLLLDQIEQHKHGGDADQPMLRTLRVRPKGPSTEMSTHSNDREETKDAAEAYVARRQVERVA